MSDQTSEQNQQKQLNPEFVLIDSNTSINIEQESERNIMLQKDNKNFQAFVDDTNSNQKAPVVVFDIYDPQQHVYISFTNKKVGEGIVAGFESEPF